MVIFVQTHTAWTRTYTGSNTFADHHGAAHQVTARARRNKIDNIRDTFSGRACAHPEYTTLYCLPLGTQLARRSMQDLRMAIAVGQQLEAEGFAGGWEALGRWADGQVARARANPQGG